MPKYSIFATRVYSSFDNLSSNNNEKYLLHDAMNIDASSKAGVIKKYNKNDVFSFKTKFAKFNRDLYMYTASYNEGLIFEDWQSTPSGNTIKALMIAKQQGVNIVTLTKEDIVNNSIAILKNQTKNRYSNVEIASIIKTLQNDNATITLPVRRVIYEGLNMSVYIAFADNYTAYRFNDNNGGASSALSTPIKAVQMGALAGAFAADFLDSSGVLTVDPSSWTFAELSSAGDPVDMLSGEFYQEEKTDLALKSTQAYLTINRLYKSQLTFNGAFGYGWAWSHMDRILLMKDNKLIYVNNKGIYSTITKNGSSYRYPVGAKYTLSYKDSKYTLNFYNGRKSIFNKNGLLLEKIDKNSNKIVFDYENNNISKIKDNKGNSLSLTYNANNKVTNINDGTGRSISYNYDGDDLIAYTDAEGNTTRYEYLKNQDNPENNHNMSKYSLPNGDFLELVYYKNDQVSHHKNSNGDTFNFQYSRYNKYAETWNEAGYYRKVYFNDTADVIRIDNEDSTIELKEYDNNHNMIAHTDANGHKLTYTYDGNRNLLSSMNDLSEVSSYEYNTLNKVTKKTDQNGNVTQYSYDNRGNLTSKKDPLLNVTSYEYDDYGNQVKITDPYKKKIIINYDDVGINITSKTDKNGNTTSHEYDGVGNRLSTTNAEGHTEYINYDNNNKVVEKIDELGNKSTLEYNKNRKLVSKTSRNNTVYQYTYHPAKDIVIGNLIKEKIDPLGNAIEYSYDVLGNKIEKKDKRGNITRYTYNKLNKISSKIDANENTTYYRYDGNGNLIEEKTSKQDGFNVEKEVIISYEYDNADRLKIKTLQNGLSITYQYDKNGNKINESYTIDSKKYNVHYYYNELNDLIKTIQGFGSDKPRVTKYEYDKLQRKIKKIDALNIETTYIYDGNNNIIEKRINNIVIDVYEYNKINKVTSHTDENGNTTQYEYNERSEKIAKIDPYSNRYEYHYDAVGNLIEEGLPNGASITYAYNDLNQQASTTNALNHTQYFEYDENGNRIRILDPKGNQTLYAYDALNQQVSKTNAHDNTATKSYDELGNIIAEVNENGTITEFSYDISNNLIQKSVFLSNDNSIETHYTYDVLNRLTGITDPQSNPTYYTYNIFNEKISTTNSLNKKSDYTYDKVGRKLSIIDFNGVTTILTYNKLGYPSSKTEAKSTKDEVITNYVYDNSGNKLSQQQADVTTSYYYDKLNRLLTTTVGNITTLSQEYDSLGNILTKTDANKNITSYEYNRNNKITAKIDAQNNKASYDYDENSNLISEVSPENIVMINSYNELDQLVNENIGDASIDLFYDKIGNITKQIDAKGIVTTTEYDGLSRVVKTTEAKETQEQTITKYYYDNNSNIVSIINPNSKTISYEYDEINRIIKHIFPSGKFKKFDYDNNSNVTSITKEDEATVIEKKYDNLNRITAVHINRSLEQSYQYDKLSRLVVSVDSNQGRKINRVNYQYDLLNNIILSDQNGISINKTYDSNSNLLTLNSTLLNISNKYNNLNRLSAIYLDDNEVANFSYNKDKKLVAANHANGMVLNINHDQRSREENREYQLDSRKILTQITSYDLNSNIIKEDVLFNNNKSIEKYTYDNLNRLIDNKNEVNQTIKNNRYSYDKVGNQLLSSLNGIEQVRGVNEDNQYIIINNDEISYSENGNLERYNGKQFYYDYLDRLIKITQNNTVLATYTYDAENRRVEKILPAGDVTTYLYHNNQVIQELYNGAPTNTYLYANYLDDPIAYQYGNDTFFYVKDRQYSIRAILNQSGQQVESYSYSPFGIVTIKDQDQKTIQASAINNSYTYTGRRLDSESNLYYYRNRYYDPSLARFISKDPKGYVDGMNLYAYVRNNPLKYLDAMGTRAYDEVESRDGIVSAEAIIEPYTYDDFTKGNSDSYQERTPENIEFYRQNGYSVSKYVLKDSYIDKANNSLDKAFPPSAAEERLGWAMEQSQDIVDLLNLGDGSNEVVTKIQQVATIASGMVKPFYENMDRVLDGKIQYIIPAALSALTLGRVTGSTVGIYTVGGVGNAMTDGKIKEEIRLATDMATTIANYNTIFKSGTKTEIFDSNTNLVNEIYNLGQGNMKDYYDRTYDLIRYER